MPEDSGIVLDEKRIKGLYSILLRRYGPQGWWPLRSRRITAGAPIGSSIGFNSGGYHPGINDITDPEERFEIAVGTVLTQNTNWNNASAAIDALISSNMLSAEAILSAPHEALAEQIRSSGYYNQKALKLKAVAELFSRNGRSPGRDELLSVWGVGPETADCIILYAFAEPVFVVDAYTRRILSRFTGDDSIVNTSYDGLRSAVEAVFYRDVESLREYHALLVLHGKRFCTKLPRCSACPVARACKKRKCLQNG